MPPSTRNADLLEARPHFAKTMLEHRRSKDLSSPPAELDKGADIGTDIDD